MGHCIGDAIWSGRTVISQSRSLRSWLAIVIVHPSCESSQPINNTDGLTTSWLLRFVSLCCLFLIRGRHLWNLLFLLLYLASMYFSCITCTCLYRKYPTGALSVHFFNWSFAVVPYKYWKNWWLFTASLIIVDDIHQIWWFRYFQFDSLSSIIKINMRIDDWKWE